MSRTRLALMIIAAAFTFCCGVWVGARYSRPISIVLERSPRCSLLDLPAAYFNRLEQKRWWTKARAESRLEKQDPLGYEYWSTPYGPWWIPKDDSKNLYLVVSEQLSDIYGGKSTEIKSGDIVLDCGAHIGTFTRKALTKGAGLVVAIEPAAENLECLRRNFAKEISAGQVVIYPKGVWDRETSLVFSSGPSAQHEVVPGKSTTDPCTTVVPLTTIDQLVKELKLKSVDFIKMDIEGAERHALAGAQATLSTYKPRMAIAGYHLIDDPAVIERVVRKGCSSYQMHSGPCYSLRGVRPDTLFFQ